MQINELIFKELIKRGYSKSGGVRVWDLSDSKLWFLTPKMSKGFLKMKKFEPYKKSVVDREIFLIKDHASKFLGSFHEHKFNLIDLGCGSGLKASNIIDAFPKNAKIRYCPVDISPYFIERALERVGRNKKGKVIATKPFTTDFKDDLGEIAAILRGGPFSLNFVLFLGDMISHFDVNETLFEISNDMFAGDYLLFGTGLKVKTKKTNLERYKDPLFNDWFIHVINGLGLESTDVSYDVRYVHDRVEGFYKILGDKQIEFKGKKVDFKEGDEIIIATEKRFSEKEIRAMVSRYYKLVDFWPDKTGEYCLVLCRK